MRPGDRKNGAATAALQRAVSPLALDYQQAQSAIRLESTLSSTAGPPGLGPVPMAIHEPGGNTLRSFLHPNFNIFEYQFRTMPDVSWFDSNVSPTNLVQFEFGHFQVPKNFAFWLFDYEFSVFRQSGLDPGDFVQAENGRFSSAMGFDLQMGFNKRASHLYYQLDPVPVVVARTSFGISTGSNNGVVPVSYSPTAPAGTSLLPVRANVQGPRNASFTLIAQPNDVVSLNCVIFKPLTSPIACVQAIISGYLVHSNISNALIARLRPA